MPRLLVALLLATNVLAAGRDLAPRPLGPSAYAPQTPLVAYAGGHYLTIWLESLDRAGWRYLGALSDPAGNRVSPSAFMVLPYGLAGPAHLISTGDAFALFFPHDDGLLMFDLDLTGSVTATRVVPIHGIRYDPEVVWNGMHFVTFERVDGESRAVLFDRGGTIARTVSLSCRSGSHRLLAVDEQVLVAATCNGMLSVDRIAPDGAVTTTLLGAWSSPFGIGVAAVRAGNDILFAWNAPELDQSLKTAILSSNGNASPARTVASGGLGQPLVPQLLLKTPNGFLLPYTVHGELRFAQLNEDGSLRAASEGPANSPGFSPSAATDGTNVFLADIYYESQFSRGSIRTRRIDAGAHVGAPEFVSIVPARQLAPAIAAGSGTLVAAWTEVQSSTSKVKAARIAADGTSLGAAVIDPDASLATDDLAWNGAAYLTVTLTGDSKLVAQRIDAFGRRIDGPAFLQDFPRNATPRVAVVWAGDRWEVVWTDGSEHAFHAEIAADGKRSSLEPLPLVGTLPDQYTRRTTMHDVALAFDGSRVLVGWIEGQAIQCRLECFELQPAFVTAIERHGVISGVPHRIGDPYDIYESLSLATNGDKLVALANRDYGTALAASFDATWAPLASRAFDGRGDVTSDAGTFVLALREREQLTVRRLDANLRDTARARIASIAPADNDRSTPSVAVAFSGNAIAGIQECDASGGRAVAYTEQELDDAPQRRRIVRR